MVWLTVRSLWRDGYSTPYNDRKIIFIRVNTSNTPPVITCQNRSVKVSLPNRLLQCIIITHIIIIYRNNIFTTFSRVYRSTTRTQHNTRCNDISRYLYMLLKYVIRTLWCVYLMLISKPFGSRSDYQIVFVFFFLFLLLVFYFFIYLRIQIRNKYLKKININRRSPRCTDDTAGIGVNSHGKRDGLTDVARQYYLFILYACVSKRKSLSTNRFPDSRL